MQDNQYLEVRTNFLRYIFEQGITVTNFTQPNLKLELLFMSIYQSITIHHIR